MPGTALAQEIRETDDVFSSSTGKWLIESIEKYKKDIRENKLDPNGKRPNIRLLDELCIQLPEDLDARLKKELTMGDSDRDILHGYHLQMTAILIDGKCWCKLYKKWNMKGKFGFVDQAAAKICPELFPKKPEEGGRGEDGPKPTPTPAPKDGPGGVKERTRACPEGFKLIDDCVKGEGISISITGDGTATSHSKLTLRNLKTGKTSSVPIETVCMSQKTKLPPPTEEVAERKNIRYRLGPPAPPFVAQTLNAVDALEQQGKYADVPIPAARRKATITQLAIWQHLGGTGKGKDAINKDNVKEDMLKKAGIKRSELSDDEDKRLEDKVALICEAVDLTCKETTTTTTERPKRKREKPGVPIPDEPTGGTTEKPRHPDDGDGGGGGGGDDRPKHPEDGGDGDEPRVPDEEIICIPELTTFECENAEYQTMCTVSDTVVDCPSDGPIPVNVPEKTGCKWSPCDVITVPHVLPRVVKKAGMGDPEERSKDEQRHASEVQAHEAALSSARDAAKAANNPRATSIVGALGPFATTGQDVYIVYLCIAADGSVNEVHTQLVSADEAQLWDPSNFNKKGNQDKREGVIQKYRQPSSAKF
jgi:hypothetical protein